MTRLKTEWIRNIEPEIIEWDKTLQERTGSGLLALAAKGSGMAASTLEEAKKGCKVGVVSITSGQGVIGTFAESVAAIVDAIGAEVRVAQKTDVDGFYELRLWGADVIFMADDDRFLAVNVNKNSIGENDRGTARGYTEALEGMMRKSGQEGMRGRKVLLLGYGRVGREIERYLLEKGAYPAIYDEDEVIQRELLAQGKDCLTDSGEIKKYDLIMDATSTGPWITRDMLHEDALIAAPGIPFSLDKDAQVHFKGRWIHDNLPIGTSVMLAFALGVEHGQ